jgi:hypothetical protein
MTTSFILISQSRFSQAFVSNKFSICLYFIFVLNEVLIFLFLANKMRRTWFLFLSGNSATVK